MTNRLTIVFASLALACFGSSAAEAQVQLSGTFTASEDCPAYQSISKHTNPGDVEVKSGQGYRLVGENKQPPTHYLVQVAGAQPGQRWVEIGCGSIDGRGPAPAPTPNPGPKPTPVGQWPDTAPTASDVYVLALSWEPDFCFGRRDPSDTKNFKAECGAETATSWDASHLALHGLWRDPYPAYKICLDDRDNWLFVDEKQHDWVHEPAVTLSSGVAAHLAEDMPGAMSHLEQHEWLVHGTCSGVGQDVFFSRAMALEDEVNASTIRDFVVAHIGDTIHLADLRAVVARIYPNAHTENVVMTCSGRALAEIDIGLMGDVTGTATLGTLLAQSHVPHEQNPCDAAKIGAPPT